MIIATVKTFKKWRQLARDYLGANIPPEMISWSDQDALQTDLFSFDNTEITELKIINKISVPIEFLELAKCVACHHDPKKWAMLYSALWRITHGERDLLKISVDPLVYDLYLMQKAIGRDCHKMKAFVRFRRYTNADKDYYVAFYEPDHYIVRRVAGFFKRRFTVMNWIIVTPKDSVAWNGVALAFFKGTLDFAHEHDDQFEELWRTYYHAIFNPARIKIKAMKREMPVRFWQHLPETRIIDNILAEAPERVAAMLKHTEGLTQSAQDFFPAELTHENLKLAVINCKACELHQCAIAGLLGYGVAKPKMMIVSDMPIDNIDSHQSKTYLVNILAKLNIQESELYYSYALKHPKQKLIDGIVTTQTPTINEITACKPWLLAEIKLLQPKVIITLGLTAAKSLLNYGFHLKAERGKLFQLEHITIIPTYHPDTVLRSQKAEMEIAFSQDLLFAKSILIN